jgi:hypothetical protein
VNRIHLFEFHDLDWFPDNWRQIMTGVMSVFAVKFDIYRPLVPKIQEIIHSLRSDRIVDLCSGGTGPLLSLKARLRTSDNQPIRLLLTDRYPNLPAFRRAAETSGDSVSFASDSVDATSVPEGIQGFRTLFGSFHHFRPDLAREILRDAALKGQGIGVFEYTERNFLVWALPIIFTPLFCWLAVPFVRPLSWRHVFWTYLVPIVPLIVTWDGFVSCMRTYSPAELRELTEGIAIGDYKWEVGRVRSFGACRVTYLLGQPARRCSEGE